MLSLAQRSQTYQKWKSGELCILCVSDLFSRGLDTQAKVVVNYTMPNHSTLYLQRAGRARHDKGIVLSMYTRQQRTIVEVLRKLLLQGRPLNNLSNYWAHYKPTLREWTARRKSSITRKLARFVLRRTVAPHAEKKILNAKATFRPPFHPRTIAHHGGIPPRQLEKIKDREAFKTWEERRVQLAQRKKGSAKFGRRKHGAFDKPFKHIAVGPEGGDFSFINEQRANRQPSITSKY